MDGIRHGWNAGMGHGDDPARRARLRRAVGGVRFRCPLRPAVRRESRRHAPRHRPPAPPRLPRRRVLRRWLGCVETMLVDSGVLAPGAVVARARKLRGEEVDEPADPEPNKPDYQPTAAGSIRQIDAKPRRAGRPRAHQAAGPRRPHATAPLHPRTPATSSPSGRRRCSPTHTPTSSPRTPSTSTPSPSTPRSCGVTMPSPSRSRSTCTTTTWSRRDDGRHIHPTTRTSPCAPRRWSRCSSSAG